MIQGTPVFNDFKGLAEMEAGARQRTPEITREAARQFEALFVQMMLKSMREAGAAFAEDRDTTYDEMFDQQIALDLTRGQGMGIADMLMRQLGAAGTDGAMQVDQAALQSRVAERAPANAATNAADTPAPAGPQREDFQPGDPESFLKRIWPLAEKAAELLGVDPRAIAAQATLETGWGQKLMRHGDGISGNNLFGIKADMRWDGDTLKVSTLEYDNGIAKREHAQFRAYPNLEDGFSDYVKFLQENPRYTEATSGGLNASDYARSLQDAGYATDPAYADKITDIMDSPRFTQTISELKNGVELPKQL